MTGSAERRQQSQIRWRYAAMKSFTSLLQRNVLDRHRWTRTGLRIAIVTWIERITTTDNAKLRLARRRGPATCRCWAQLSVRC